MVYDLTDDVSVSLMLSRRNLSQNILNVFLGCLRNHALTSANILNNVILNERHFRLDFFTVGELYNQEIIKFVSDVCF